MYYLDFINSVEKNFLEHQETLRFVEKSMNSDLIAINRIYSALLISLYSTFESRLTDLCILFHQTGLPDVSINNFK